MKTSPRASPASPSSSSSSLPGAADERPPLLVLVRAGRLADEHHVRASGPPHRARGSSPTRRSRNRNRGGCVSPHGGQRVQREATREREPPCSPPASRASAALAAAPFPETHPGPERLPARGHRAGRAPRCFVGSRLDGSIYRGSAAHRRGPDPGAGAGGPRRVRAQALRAARSSSPAAGPASGTSTTRGRAPTSTPSTTSTAVRQRRHGHAAGGVLHRLRQGRSSTSTRAAAGARALRAPDHRRLASTSDTAGFNANGIAATRERRGR